MSVKVRPYRGGDGWEVDITFRLPNGRRWRERAKAPASSKSGALRWGQDRERHLLQHGPDKKKKEVPTLEEFASRFITGHAVANRQKPSGVAAKQTILDVHLVPALGTRKLDAITNEDVQRLKQKMHGKAPKTVNNVLSVLSVLLKKAMEWDVIDRMPCTVRLLKAPKTTMGFWDFQAYANIVTAAKANGVDSHLIVLLGGDAGLRCGEIIGLEWADIDFDKRQLCVQRSEWRGHVTAPKGGRFRYVPMTTRLTEALREYRQRRGRVVRDEDGQPYTQDMVGDRVRRAARNAGVAISGVHRLRHTFCSHLAMRGAPGRAIQEAAGHQDLVTTQRYMHLSPAAVESAIRLLELPLPAA